MNEQIYQHYWVTLKGEVRSAIAEMFNMKRSIISEVCDNKLVSDGYSNNDLKSITLAGINEKMATKFDKLEEAFKYLVDFIENPPLLANNLLNNANEETIKEDSITVVESTTSVPTGGSSKKTRVSKKTTVSSAS